MSIHANIQLTKLESRKPQIIKTKHWTKAANKTCHVFCNGPIFGIVGFGIRFEDPGDKQGKQEEGKDDFNNNDKYGKHLWSLVVGEFRLV